MQPRPTTSNDTFWNVTFKKIVFLFLFVSGLSYGGFFYLSWTKLSSSDQQHQQQPKFKTSNRQKIGFIVMGDFGTGLPDQFKVAKALHRFAKSVKPAFLISTGDQIYSHGISSAVDPQLSSKFEKVYNYSSLAIPWYISIGNHDCEGSIDSMLEYANRYSDKWYFPSRYYYVDHKIDSRTIVRMIVLDACDLVCGKKDKDFRCIDNMNNQTSEKTRSKQYTWLKNILNQPKPKGIQTMWKIVVAHWSVYSYAGNADTAELISNLEPILKRFNVHVYFNGHDHCMQHIRKNVRTKQKNFRGENVWYPHYFVSGAGGYRLHTLSQAAKKKPDLKHVAMIHGFMYAQVSSSKFTVQFIDSKGRVNYMASIDYSLYS